MASLATSRQESLDYIAQAELLIPNDPRIYKAREWALSHFDPEVPPAKTVSPLTAIAASKRVSDAPAQVETPSVAAAAIAAASAAPTLVQEPVSAAKAPRRKGKNRVFRTMVLLLLISLAVISSLIAYMILNRDSLMNRDQVQGTIREASDTLVVASMDFEVQEPLISTATGSPTPTATPTTLPTVSPSVEPTVTLPDDKESLPSEKKERASIVQPKNVTSQRSENLPTWTPTPRPTETPTPSPTPYPTFVSAPSDTSDDLPYGLAVGEKWIDVDISTQSLIAYEGDIPVFDSLVSTGTASHPTVTGQFRIWLRLRSQDMDGYRLGYDYFLRNVPYVQYFYYDYSLHGTFWHNNFGHPMSHGCVNLPTPSAEWLYNWADYGTLVNIHT
ncbi:MAG: L,D-transpeptidase [Candidatus Promineifilaceae bacterium]